MPHLAETVLMLVDLSLYLIFGGGYLEGTSPHPHRTHPDTVSGIRHIVSPLIYFYFFQFVPIRVETGRFGPIPVETGAKWQNQSNSG